MQHFDLAVAGMHRVEHEGRIGGTGSKFGAGRSERAEGLELPVEPHRLFGRRGSAPRRGGPRGPPRGPPASVVGLGSGWR